MVALRDVCLRLRVSALSVHPSTVVFLLSQNLIFHTCVSERGRPRERRRERKRERLREIRERDEEREIERERERETKRER